MLVPFTLDRLLKQGNGQIYFAVPFSLDILLKQGNGQIYFAVRNRKAYLALFRGILENVCLILSLNRWSGVRGHDCTLLP
jgi:hypothetical protein